MNTRPTNAHAHPGLVDVEPKAPRRTSAQVAEERNKKAVIKEQRANDKVAKAQRLEKVNADASAEDASYATPIPPRSRRVTTALARTESVTSITFDEAGTTETADMPPPPPPGHAGSKKGNGAPAKSKANSKDGPSRRTRSSAGPTADVTATTTSNNSPPFQDGKAPGERTVRKPPSKSLATPPVRDEPAPVTKALPPMPGRRPRPPPKAAAEATTQQPAPSGDDARRPTSNTTHKALQESAAKRQFAATAIDENPDDSMTEEDSQAPEYVAPTQTKRNVANRSSGYESHEGDQAGPPKKKMRAPVDEDKGHSGPETKNTDARRRQEGDSSKATSATKTGDEQVVGKKGAAKKTPAVGPGVTSHHNTVKDKMKATPATSGCVQLPF